MNKIFISYRREDSEGFARSLFQSLSSHFGKDKVFMDVEAIGLGMDFVEAIESSLADCGALLVLIGKDWVDSTDANGRKRLDDPNDFVRTEVAKAIQRNVRVIPVLVKGTPMPKAEELPEELRSITRRQAMELRHERWEQDVSHLATSLEKALGLRPIDKTAPQPSPSSPQTLRARPNPLKKWISIGVSAAITLLVFGYMIADFGEDAPIYIDHGAYTEPVTYPPQPVPAPRKEMPPAQEEVAKPTEQPARSELPAQNKVTSLTGIWINDDGARVEIYHNGVTARSQFLDPATGVLIQADWVLNGRNAEFNWASAAGNQGFGRGLISSDFNSIQYEYIDYVTGLQDVGELVRAAR